MAAIITQPSLSERAIIGSCWLMECRSGRVPQTSRRHQASIARKSGGNGMVTYQTLPLYQTGPMPFGYNDPLHIADISTTATFNGGVTTCFNLQAVSDMTTFNQLHVLHLEGNTLIDRTTSHFFPQRQLCANTTTISPFVISQNPNAAPTAADGYIGGTITDGSCAPVIGVTIHSRGSQLRVS